MLHTGIIHIPVDEGCVVVDLLVELGREALEDPEDGFKVRLHVPEEVQTVSLDLGERLLMGDDVPILVLLGLQDTDDACTDPGGTVVIERLFVDVEGVRILLEGTALYPGVQFLPRSVVPFVRIGIQGELGDIEGAGLEVLEVIFPDDIVGRGDTVPHVLACSQIGSVAFEWKECDHYSAPKGAMDCQY